VILKDSGYGYTAVRRMESPQVCKHFKLYDLCSPEIIDLHGFDAKNKIDSRLYDVLDLVWLYAGKFKINDWFQGGQIENNGFVLENEQNNFITMLQGRACICTLECCSSLDMAHIMPLYLDKLRDAGLYGYQCKYNRLYLVVGDTKKVKRIKGVLE
jgi:hypothetical protein